MYSAPSVSYPVGRSHFYAAVAASVWLLTGAVVGYWVAQVAEPDVRQGVMLLLWLSTGAALAWAWHQSPQGLLRWDGRQWWWKPADAKATASDGLPGELVVHLDLQQVLLASVRQPGRAPLLWLWLEGKQQSTSWHALRCAVFSQPGEAQP
jgi:toxin CptA